MVLFGLSTETGWTYGLKTCMCTEVDYIWSRFTLSIGIHRQHVKKKRYYFADKGPSSQSYGFSSSLHGCESWTIKKAEHWRIDAFEMWCWRRLLRVPWTARRSHQSILKKINSEYSLKGLMLKLQYFGHLMWRTDSLEKTLVLGKIEGRTRRGMTEDELVGWHHWLDGHEFE